jgi:hypothetical protein
MTENKEYASIDTSEISPCMYVYTLPNHLINGSGSITITAKPYAEPKVDEYKMISVACNRTVMNKIDKVFRLAKKYKVEITDIEITEYAHPAWLPETKGTFGGDFKIIVKNPTEDFLNFMRWNIPMTRVSDINQSRFEGARIDW